MVSKVASEVRSDNDFHELTIDESNFLDTIDTGETIPAGTTREVAQFELSEDGEMSDYDLLSFGQNTDGVTNESAKGKLFAAMANTAGEAVPKGTRFRIVSRPRNDERTTKHTGWLRLSNTDVEDPAKRLPFRPVTRNGKRVMIKANRIVAIEVRNPAEDIEVERENCEWEFPAVAGF